MVDWQTLKSRIKVSSIFVGFFLLYLLIEMVLVTAISSSGQCMSGLTHGTVERAGYCQLLQQSWVKWVLRTAPAIPAFITLYFYRKSA